MSKEIEKARAEVERTGHALQKLRAKAAPKLSENIRSNLRDLGFRQSEFEAKLTALDQAQRRPASMRSSCFFLRTRASR